MSLTVIVGILLFKEDETCHDNCGKISNGAGCSCDWECHNNNNCCSDIREHCPFSKFCLSKFVSLFIKFKMY